MFNIRLIIYFFIPLAIGITFVYASPSFALNPRAAQSVNQGLEQKKLKNYDKAINHLNKAIKLEPAYVTPYLERARIRRIRQEPLLALQDLRKVVELDPAYSEAWENMGDVYLLFRQTEDAYLCYQRAIESTTDEGKRAELKFVLGELGQGLTNSVGDEFDRKAVTAHRARRLLAKPVLGVDELIGPPSASVGSSKKLPFPMAGPLAKTEIPETLFENIDESMKHYRTALELQPDDAASHEAMALLYQMQGRPLDAIRHYEEVLRIKPLDVETMIALGDIYSISLNDNRKALYWYAMAITNEPDETKKKSIADRVSKFMAGR